MRSRTAIPALLALTQAHIIKRDLTVQTLDKWGSLGCWSDSQSARTLSVAAHFGEHVSDTNCQYQCQQLGYAYAGTEYSGQCYCDNDVNTAAVKKPDSDCNMACTGDNTQPCGGPDRINLFWNGTQTTTTTPVAANTSTGADGWVAEGCYTDDVGKRALPVKVNTAGGASQMTTKTCVDACYAAGYTLAGTEYAQECYCGNAIQNGQSLASDQSTCSMTCKGDPTTYCGGPGRMNLYSYGGATPAVAAPAASSAAPAKVKPTLPTGWTTLGCYSDNNGKRALTKAFFNEPSSGMTVEYCVSQCNAAGYSIAGVEYGGECYCDTAIQNNQGQASDGDTGCNMACHGNAGEICGGPNRINIYASGGWVQLGCYSDQNYKRTLAQAPAVSPLTNEACMATCHAAGYAYSGTEYGNECHCGSSFDNGGGPASDGNAGCSFACAGNSSEICGGAARLSMFAFINPDGTISSTTPSATPTPTPAGSPAAETNVQSGWTYDGCYTDQTNGRILAHQMPDSSNLTAGNCITACSAAGYSIAGLEYSSQCFCDNAIQNGGAPAGSGKCTMTCSGDPSKTCGGPGVMDLYSTGSLTSASKPTTQTTGLPDGWSYDNCYADAVGARIFSVESDLSNASATSCIGYCSGVGYAVAGIEYANQCFCGTIDQKAAASTSNQCSMTCAGDSTHICGGPGAMTVYTQS